MDEIEVNKAKVLRGDIIEILYRNYGVDIKIAVLKNCLRLNGWMTDEDIKKAVYYLGGEGKRYVHTEPSDKNFFDSLIWLTPLGVNLAEGDIKDVGVVLDE